METGGLHLARQPFPTIQADLYRKGEPGLDTGMEEAEDGVDLVVIEEQTPAGAQLELELFLFAIAMNLEFPTGFEAAEHAHQAGADAILSQDVAGDGLFVELTGIEILHRASASLGCSQGSLFDPLGDLLHVVAKVLEEDLVSPEIAQHPLRSADGAQVSTKY